VQFHALCLNHFPHLPLDGADFGLPAVFRIAPFVQMDNNPFDPPALDD
jgi:hypothetical protein